MENDDPQNVITKEEASRNMSYRPGSAGVFGVKQPQRSVLEDMEETEKDGEKEKGTFETMLQDEHNRNEEAERSQFFVTGRSILYDDFDETPNPANLSIPLPHAQQLMPKDLSNDIDLDKPFKKPEANVKTPDELMWVDSKEEVVEENTMNSSFMEEVSSGSSLDMDTGSGVELSTNLAADEDPQLSDEELQGVRSYTEENFSDLRSDISDIARSPTLSQTSDNQEDLGQAKTKKQSFLRRFFMKDKKT